MKNNTKIFKHNLNNNSKTIQLKVQAKTQQKIGSGKYLPSFSKEWKNTIYSFNKNIVSAIPVLTENINKIINSYFNLFFKDNKDLEMKYIMLKRRRNFLRRIFVSDAEIKHNNDKMVITLYTLNREKNILKNKYFQISRKINKILLERFFKLYGKNIVKIYKSITLFKNKYKFVPSVLKKRTYLQSKLWNLKKFHIIKHIVLKKTWAILLNYYLTKHFSLLRKYNLLYSLNVLKFNKLSLLPVLSNVLQKILPKKIEYNIINLKHFINNPDIFTNIIALKLKRKRINRLREINRIISRTKLPIVNTIQERTFVSKNIDPFLSKYQNTNVLSSVKNEHLDNLLAKENENENITKSIYHSIRYKNIAGIKIEAKGRLTKRYRADRSVYSLRWKGGLKNIDSSFQRKSTVLWRGNVNSNTAYAISTAKRRIGAFAVKGWIGGK
jgi:hypothetical protein